MFGRSDKEMCRSRLDEVTDMHFQTHVVKTKSRVFKCDTYIMEFTKIE